MVDTKKKRMILQKTRKKKDFYNKPVLLYHSAKIAFNFMVKKKSPAINLYFTQNSDILS